MRELACDAIYVRHKAQSHVVDDTVVMEKVGVSAADIAVAAFRRGSQSIQESEGYGLRELPETRLFMCTWS